jgi:uncharacterized membrane protein YeaQ/YmgE (transglycosylase-associated protein family)
VGIIWTSMIGVHRGRDREAGYSIEPSGFILTTVLGIVGAFVASWLGQALGWYGPGEGAGLIGAVVGAIVLLIWGAVSKPKSPSRRVPHGSRRHYATGRRARNGTRPTPMLIRFNVRFGSQADICSATAHVRSGPIADVRVCNHCRWLATGDGAERNK